MKARKWVLVQHFDGEPKDEDLQLVEEELPDELQEGEVLLEAVYLSVDPYMRFVLKRFLNFVQTVYKIFSLKTIHQNYATSTNNDR